MQICPKRVEAGVKKSVEKDIHENHQTLAILVLFKPTYKGIFFLQVDGTKNCMKWDFKFFWWLLAGPSQDACRGTTPHPVDVFLKQMVQPRPLFRLFWSFQTNIITIFTTNICEKCPSSIWCQDSNPRPLTWVFSHNH